MGVFMGFDNLVNTLSKCNFYGKNHEYVAFNEQKGWYLTRDKSKAMRPDLLFKKLGDEFAKAYQNQTLTRQQWTDMLVTVEGIKRNYDKSTGVFHQIFGLFNKKDTNEYYHRFHETLQQLAKGKSLKFETDKKGHVISKLERKDVKTLVYFDNVNHPQEDLSELLYLIHPDVESLNLLLHFKSLSLSQFKKILLNCPNLKEIQMGHISNNKAKNFQKVIKESGRDITLVYENTNGEVLTLK